MVVMAVAVMITSDLIITFNIMYTNRVVEVCSPLFDIQMTKQHVF